MSEAGQGGTPSPAGTTWFGGYDADTQAHIATRGWDKLPVDQAVAQAVKAHREAEKMIGVPAEQLLRAPKDGNDKENLAKIYARLGVPADPKEYDFSGLKHKSGDDVKPEFVENVRALAAKYNLPKDVAKSLAADLIAENDTRTEAQTAEYTAKLATEKETLKTNWGANTQANMIVAQNAAQKLGVTAEHIAALEKAVGYAGVMEMFRKIGAATGEDKFVTNGGQGGGAMTKEQAQQKLDALQKDTIWMEKFNKGDTAAVQEFHNLTRLVCGQ